MAHILLAHAPEEESRGSLVAEKLASLGYEVRQDDDVYRAMSPFERRKLAAQVADAACVIVLWSRDGVEAPALQAAAQAAKAQGKLALARLDASAPPSRMGRQDIANLAQWYGLDQARGWRDLLEAVSAKTKPSGKKPTTAPRATGAPIRASAVAAASSENKASGGRLGAALALLVVLSALGGGAFYYLNYMQ